MNSVIRYGVLLILLLPVSMGFAQEHQQYYKQAYRELLKNYQQKYVNFDEAHGHCGLQKFPKTNYAILADKLPKNLSRPQINAALYLQQRNYQKKCVGSALSAYFDISADLISVFDQSKIKNFNFIAIEEEIKLRKEIEKTFRLVKIRQKPYFRYLAAYQSIQESDKTILLSIPELNNHLNYVRLIDQYFNNKVIYKKGI